MVESSKILAAVYSAVASTNEVLPAESKLLPEESESIIGAGAKIDSLGFVSLMVAIEQEVEAVAGSCPSLVEKLSDPDAGISTLGELVDFIAARVSPNFKPLCK